MISNKAPAVLKKDVLTALRYRNGFVLGGLGMAAQLATFYYLSRAVCEQFRPDWMPYFLFLLVETGFFSFLITGMHSFLRTIQESQQSGTLEVLMTTSTHPAVLLSLSAVSAFARGLAQLVLYVGAGILLFSPAVHMKLLGCAAVVILSVLISIAIGIFAVNSAIAMDELGKCRACGNRVSAGIMHPGGHNQKIVGIFVQMVIRFSEQRQAGRIPYDLIDPNHMRIVYISISLDQASSRQLQQEDRLAVDRAYINRPVKRYGETRLKVESIQLI
jgi:hypothetical protein